MASVAVAGLATSPARADVASVREHRAQDALTYTPAQEQAVGRRSRAATAADAAAAAAAVVGGPGQVGEWGPVLPWQNAVLGTHVALMPDGKVLAYDSVTDRATETSSNQSFTRAAIWDPRTPDVPPVRLDVQGYNIFCSGLAHLADGRLFVAGGNKNQNLDGIVQTHLFTPGIDPKWTRTADMATERWYPSVTPQPTGEMLITAGERTGQGTPEVRGVDGAIRPLPGAAGWLPQYPWLDVAPNGRTVMSGPLKSMAAFSTAGGGSREYLTERDAIDRDYGSRALFDIGKLLVAGGGPSTKNAVVVDITPDTPTVRPAAPMTHGRRQHNLTVLADGSVLATGGLSSGASLVDMAAGVYAAERWDPATGAWSTLATMKRTRQYHSTALLLPDGRVVSSGGGICGKCDADGYLEKNAEVFSPPYLFRADGSPAPRPVIDAAPSTAAYDAPLGITTADPASIRKVALIRLGAVTHSVEMEQRYVPLRFSTDATGLTATGPANANVAPPGVYMLVIVDADGVPSVARMLRLRAAPSVAMTSPAAGASFAAPASIELAASASDVDGGVTKVEFFHGTTELAEDTTPPYSYTWNGVEPGTYAVSARATDTEGLEASAERQIVVAAPATVVVPSPGPLSGGTATVRPRSRVVLRSLKIIGSRRTRRLLLTTSRATTVRVALSRRRAGRWTRVPGRRTVRLRAGRVSISLREPWAGRRLRAGTYRVAVSVGSRVTYRTFVVR